VAECGIARLAAAVSTVRRRIIALFLQDKAVAYPEIFSGEGFARNFFRGVQQIQLRTEGRENGDLGTIAPSQGFHSVCK
jgi:hypothetical protein